MTGASSKFHFLKEASPIPKTGKGDRGGLKINKVSKKKKSAGDQAGSLGTGERK